MRRGAAHRLKFVVRGFNGHGSRIASAAHAVRGWGGGRK